MKMIDKKHQEWQQRNADKTKAYTAKYEASRVKVSVTLKKEIAEQIDKIKPPSQTYGGWIRELVEKYIDNLE
ncbi:MAG: hypothetical protein HEQ24_06145 [Dolichospermum sp. BR01]|nr:hypothetical protein [Dolichospermum sp. BR01]